MGSTSKKRRKYREQQLRIYEQINKEYELGLRWDEYEPEASEYASQKAESEKGFFGGLFGDIFGGIFNIVLAVVGVVLSVFTGGSTLAITLTAVAGAVSVFAYGYSKQLEGKMAFANTKSQMLEGASASLTAAEEAKFSKDQITHYLIWSPYEIFADGDIYKAQSAGSETYSPSIAYDPAKGILGKYQKDPIDEKINNRIHSKEAGNADYMANTLGLDIPLSVFDLSAKAKNDALENNMRRANARIVEGFNKLIENYHNILGRTQSIFDRVFNDQVAVFWGKMITNDFLDKQKNYQKGKRADFFYLNYHHFKTNKDKTPEELAQKFKDMWDFYAERQKNPYATLEEKAFDYYGSVLLLFETLRGFKEVGIAYYSTFYPSLSYANVGSWYLQQQVNSKLQEAAALRDEAIAGVESYLQEPHLKESLAHLETYKKYMALYEECGKYTYQTGWSEDSGSSIRYLSSLIFGGRQRIFVENLQTSFYVDMNMQSGLSIIVRPPFKSVKIEDHIAKLNGLSISEAVYYYEKRVKGRVISNPFYGRSSTGGGINRPQTPQYDFQKQPYLWIVEEKVGENVFLGFFGVDKTSYETFSKELPKNEGLENYEWEKLDV